MRTSDRNLAIKAIILRDLKRNFHLDCWIISDQKSLFHTSIYKPMSTEGIYGYKKTSFIIHLRLPCHLISLLVNFISSPL